jgi:uncharacterized membrane protein
MIEHFPSQRDIDEARLVVQPNLSLTLRQLATVFAVLAVVTIAVAGIAWLQGNFFALPFAALYLSMLAVCLALVRRQGRRAEVVAIVAGRLSVRRLPELVEVFADDPQWVRVVEAEGHVWLSGRQRRVEVGGFLGEDERRQLAGVLRRMLNMAPGPGTDGERDAQARVSF